MNIFFLLDSSIQELITLVQKGLIAMGTSSPMQTFKFNQAITWPFTNLVKTYEGANLLSYNRKMEIVFIFAAAENEIFPYNMIYTIRFAQGWINSISIP